MFQIVMVALTLLAGGVAAVHYLDKAGRTPSAMTATPAPAPVATSPASRSVVLQRGRGGHFQASARVDGRPLDFLVDTGATHIALRASEAARAGIFPRAADYKHKVNTANGITLAALVNLRSVEIGGITLRDLPALVHDDTALPVNLLGMSFLSRVRWTHDKGRLYLEH